MKTGIMQPYLFPYIGYFQLINCVDKFIIHDDVQWIKGGWINRNRILNDNQEKLITLSVKKRSSLDKIMYFEIDENPDNKIRFINQVKSSYNKSPFFEDVFPVIEKIINNNEKNLSKFILKSLLDINSYIGIKTPIYVSSEIKKNNELKSQDRVLDICKNTNTTTYINPIGGTLLYDKNQFSQNKVDLFFIKTKEIKYKQFNNEFIPSLSIIDVMMFNSRKKINEILNQYDLL